jgi:hypothetical protein
MHKWAMLWWFDYERTLFAGKITPQQIMTIALLSRLAHPLEAKKRMGRTGKKTDEVDANWSQPGQIALAEARFCPYPYIGASRSGRRALVDIT